MMRVRYDKRLWELDMSPRLFEKIKKEHPTFPVTIEELCLFSCYAERKRIAISELEAQ